MIDINFYRVAAVSPVMSVGNVHHNYLKTIDIIEKCKDCDLIVFPELSLTGYTCGDLFHNGGLLYDVDHVVSQCNMIQHQLKHSELDTVVVVGAPIRKLGMLFNCAVFISATRQFAVPKQYLPNYGEFYERRWFSPGSYLQDETYNELQLEIYQQAIAQIRNDYFGEDVFVGAELCEDLWSPTPPSNKIALAGASVICNLSASNEIVGKDDYRRSLVANQSARLLSAYVYASAGVHESTSDVVFSGHCIIAENGVILAESQRFSFEDVIIKADIDLSKLSHERMRQSSFGECANKELKGESFKYIPMSIFHRNEEEKEKAFYRHVAPYPFIPYNENEREKRCKDIIDIQVAGLARRMKTVNAPAYSIGVSGGLDSTLALFVAAKASYLAHGTTDRILGVTMPGFGSTNRTITTASNLTTGLGINMEEIPIKNISTLVMHDIKHNPFGLPIHYAVDLYGAVVDLQQGLEKLVAGSQDLAFENIQARVRTLVLMSKGFVIGTGNMSEMALGWCTYNGDHMSMYNVNCGVPKTLVIYLVKFLIEDCKNWEFIKNYDLVRLALQDVLDTPISPELLPTKEGESSQNTEDCIGPYVLHDFFLFHYVREGASKEKILYLATHSDLMNRFSAEEVEKWLNVFLKRFQVSQFKRNCVPDGPKVGTVSLSPRGDWRMPSDIIENP